MICALVSSTALSAFAASEGRDAGAIYKELCANCHGDDFKGAKGPSLWPDQLKHARSDRHVVEPEEIFKNLGRIIRLVPGKESGTGSASAASH